MRSKIWLTLLALFAAALILGGGECEEVESECEWDGDCGENTSPVLSDMVYSVNGGAATTEIPEISRLGTIVFAASYADDQGNLEGGTVFLEDKTFGETYSTEITADLGCSSTESGSMWGYTLDGPTVSPAIGYHAVEMYFTDSCGYASNRLDAAFYVK